MHTLKLLQKPCKLHSVRYGMSEHSEFLVTNANYMQRCDLGLCVVQLRPPYFVARLRMFKTTDKRVEVSERNEQERCQWLTGRMNAYATAQEAAKKGLTMRELCGDHYDEELDEPRMIAKVPGLNAYLELLGTMGPQDVGGEQYWAEEHKDSAGGTIRQPFDRMIDAAAATALNRMAYFVRATMPKKEQRDCGSRMGDWQPRDDWQEDFDAEEYFQRPEQRGIGFDHVDESRREVRFPKHTLTDAERAEYQKLKQEAIDRGDTLDNEALARLAQQACENVAAYKLIKD